MKKTILLITIFLASCLSQQELTISTKLDDQTSELISIDYDNKSYLIGEDIDIELKSKKDVSTIYLKLELNRNKFKIDKIQKFDFSDDNFVMSKVTDYGYEIIFSDLSEKNLNKEQKFATITLVSGWVGDEIINFKAGSILTGD